MAKRSCSAGRCARGASRYVPLLVAALPGTLLLLSVAGRGAQPPRVEKHFLVYVGTYTAKTNSKGIYACRFDATTGKVTPIGTVAETANPSFLAVHPNGRFLYAVNEMGDYEGKKSGAVSAFAIDRATGKLTLLNQVASRGADPCYVSLDKTGKYLLVANYTGGSVIVFPVLADGRLGDATAFVQHEGHGMNPERQEGPHAHMIEVSPDNRFAIAADLGLDELLVYRFNAAKGSLAPNDPPFAKVNPGAGPRHFAFHPAGRFVHVLNEMGSTVTTFSYQAAGGVLRELQSISILPKDFAGTNTSAEIEVHPSGKFLYASNRGHDSVAVFAIDTEKGTLMFVAHVPTQGKTPRHFAIDPTGTFLFAANQDSGNVVLFRIDPKTGGLTPTGQALEVPSPVCVAFLPVD